MPMSRLRKSFLLAFSQRAWERVSTLRTPSRCLRSMSTEISRSRLKIQGLDRTTCYQLDRWASQDPNSLSVDDMLDMSEEKWFNIVKDEVTVRLANAIMELLYSPGGLCQETEFKKIIQGQVQSFNEMVAAKDIKYSDRTNRQLFEKNLSYIRKRHKNLIKEMSDACQTFGKNPKKRAGNSNCMTDECVQNLLDRFFTTKISIDLIIDVYSTLRQPKALEKLVSRRHDLKKIISEAHYSAARHCEAKYQVFPEDPELTGEKEIVISCLPDHLKYIFFEVFKNSIQANVVSRRRREETKPLEIPAIKILGIVSKSQEDVSVRVSDLGQGISRAQVDSVMQYGVTANTGGLGGLGYGLPMSRMYARYFQGDLSLYSMHGLGTDVFLYLRALGARECLPKYNVSSKENLIKPDKINEDWI